MYKELGNYVILHPNGIHVLVILADLYVGVALQLNNEWPCTTTEIIIENVHARQYGYQY